MDEHATPESLGAEALETWSAFATVLEWLPAALDAQLTRDAGLTHFEYGVLFALSTAPERTLRMSVLASYSNSTLSRLSRAATRLEAKGWVRRWPDPADGRFTLATLTDAGAQKVDEAGPGRVSGRCQFLEAHRRSSASQRADSMRRISAVPARS